MAWNPTDVDNSQQVFGRKSAVVTERGEKRTVGFRPRLRRTTTQSDTQNTPSLRIQVLTLSYLAVEPFHEAKMDALATARRRPNLFATLLAIFAVGLVMFTFVRGHPIDKRDLGDLYGCYAVEGQTLFRLTQDEFVTPTTTSARGVAFTARQGRFKAYLDLAIPMRVVHRGAELSFGPGPGAAIPIEVYRGSPRAMLLQSESGPPLKAIRTECRR